MPRPDPLAALLRLRNLQVATAQRDLANKQTGAQRAEAAAATATAALREEALAAVQVPAGAAHYAAWLPLGMATHKRRLAEAREANGELSQAQADLVASRAAERAVELAQAMAEERERRNAA